MNAEEQQLSDMLRRVTPEPPHRVTVEDVAFRLANQAAGSGRRRHREARAERGSLGYGSQGRRSAGRGSWGFRARAWAPALAAASVIVVASASAGVAALVSHHGPVSSTGSVVNPASSPAVTHSAKSTASPGPKSTEPAWPPERIANGPWGAELLDPDSFTQDSLVGAPNSLYATSTSLLVRMDPATGNVLAQQPYDSPVPGYPNPPVVTGTTVWMLSSYSGSRVVLQGYDGKTLSLAGSVTVPVSGQLSSAPEGVLTSGPGGYLYVAAGSSVVVVNPRTYLVVKQISVSAGPVSSVAVSPDGSKLYASTSGFELLTYSTATGARLGSSAMTGLTSTAGNLVATFGGVWGTTGVGMTESAWFAPDADLTRMVRLAAGTGAGLSSIPTVSGGAVWIGGSHTLVCASPVTGQVLGHAAIPTDRAVLEYFSSVTVTGGRAFALYQNQAAERTGLVALTPPSVCSG
jgi:hypothetical protein